jgi:hypothetical protein
MALTAKMDSNTTSINCIQCRRSLSERWENNIFFIRLFIWVAVLCLNAKLLPDPDRGEAAPDSARFKAALLKATPTKHTMVLACEATGTIDETKGKMTCFKSAGGHFHNITTHTPIRILMVSPIVSSAIYYKSV